MKFRLRASISPLFTGGSRSSICRAIAVAQKFSLFNGDGASNRILSQGFGSLQRSMHSSSHEADDFSELGPVTQASGSPLKLVTQKSDPYMKNNGARIAPSSRFGPAESSTSSKDNFSSLGKPSPAHHPKVGNQNGNSSYDGYRAGASYFRSSSSVTIEDVPSIVKLTQLIEAISVFGKISSASVRTSRNGLNCYDVKFENLESSKKAVTAGGITVRSFSLPVRSLFDPETVTIRIRSISKETADPLIHSKCKSIGVLEGLTRPREDVVDAFFTLRDETELQSVLEKLNNTIIDHHQWSAYVLPRNYIPMEVSEKEDGKRKLGLEISNHLRELKEQLALKRIYSEDLELLHLGIMHLGDQPPGGIRSNKD